MQPFTNVSFGILYISMDLNIRTLLIVMKMFCGNSNLLFQLRNYILSLSLMTMNLGIILLLNGS